MTARPFRVALGSEEVVGVLYLPAGPSCACVVACHGMGASKDSDKYGELGRELPAAGLALARFDFRGSGESGGTRGDATIGSRVSDLEAVLDHLARRPELDGRFGLLGSSLGGFVALWTAARRSPPPPVVTWNAPADLRQVQVDDPAACGPSLVAEVMAGRYAEAPAGVSRVLVIQAEHDLVVPPSHGRALLDRCADPKALVLVPGADHRLTREDHRRDAIERSRRWIARHLDSVPEHLCQEAS